jgi:hypothetical protein
MYLVSFVCMLISLFAIVRNHGCRHRLTPENASGCEPVNTAVRALAEQPQPRVRRLVRNTGGCRGGAIYNGGRMTVTNSTLANINLTAGGPGFAFGEGGGAFNAGTLSVINSTFSANSAFGGGGGIANIGALAVTNSTFTDNNGEEGRGGGIFNGGSLYIASSTFCWNFGGGAGSSILDNAVGSTTIKSTILALGFAGNSPEANPESVRALTDAGYNISDDSCSFQRHRKPAQYQPRTLPGWSNQQRRTDSYHRTEPKKSCYRLYPVSKLYRPKREPAQD